MKCRAIQRGVLGCVGVIAALSAVFHEVSARNEHTNRNEGKMHFPKGLNQLDLVLS